MSREGGRDGDVTRISRNESCPCGSGKKHKQCCLGKVAWEQVRSEDESIRHASTRGKNLLFLNDLADILQLDKLAPRGSWANVKRAVTPAAVRRIYERVAAIWPDAPDLKRVLASERAAARSGLYVGTYTEENILKGVTRHSLYADTILLVDPFMYPSSVRDEFNPVLHPDKYLTVAIRNLRVWWELAPWIEAGIVRFIRVPGDFDVGLNWECMRLEELRLERHPELKSFLEQGAELMEPEMAAWREYLFLHHPDEYIADVARNVTPGISGEEVATLLEWVRRRRQEHPYFTDNKVRSELFILSSGTNYQMAHLTSMLTGSHLITDIPSRWKEIEIDRKESQVDDAGWAPFAKAFQAVKLKHLENVTLAAALQLRKENRLESMRALLRRLWQANASEDPFSAEKAESLAAELHAHIDEADQEWREIDTELLRRFGSQLAAAIVAAGPVTAWASVGWVGAAVAVAGATDLISAELRRAGFKTRFPAAFFLHPRQ